MKALRILSKKYYFLIFITSIILFFLLNAYLQTRGIISLIPIWFLSIPIYNKILFLIFLLLFGLLTAYQIYLWREEKSCNIETKVKGTGFSTLGSFTVILAAQCPSCMSFIALILPISSAAFLINNSWLLNLTSIALMIFALYISKGFEN